MIELLIGFRAHITESNEKELEFQCIDARNKFPRSQIFIACTGKKPNTKILANSDKISYLSKAPMGFSKPYDEIINYVKKNMINHIILVDGDCQHIFSEIKRIIFERKVQINFVEFCCAKVCPGGDE